MGCLTLAKFTWVLVLLEILVLPICWGDTDPRDVSAINSLYASLGHPPLLGWVPSGGDPCGETWQGVQCVNANITGLDLNGANLGGLLSDNLGAFPSILQIDLRNNRIGGGIPSSLPITLNNLSLNDNLLSGVIPDVFQQLPALQYLDLSRNQFIGPLPSSMGNLTLLTILHLQNNQLSGTLNVLQDLPLQDLNIENNRFSGPIPDKLLAIPSFSRSGNPFNSTDAPSPPAVSPSLSPSGTPGSDLAPKGQVTQAPSFSDNVVPSKKTKKISWMVVSGVVLLIIFSVGLCLFILLCCQRRKAAKSDEMYGVNEVKESPKNDHSLNKPFHQTKKETHHGKDYNWKTALVKKTEHKIDISSDSDKVSLIPPSSLPLPINSVDNKEPKMTSRRPATENVNDAKFFTIASLQQYTSSFAQENLIGRGILGTVYKAELPSGRPLAVKKLDTGVILHQSDEEFLDLVSHVSEIKHPNIVQLVGYCVEHGQRLLISEFCTNVTLNEALHLDDEINKSLSWNTRMQLALDAARAIEYLHEVCSPPVIHQNFKSVNIFLDDDLVVRVSDCGLAPLLPPNSITQLQGNGYGAPELELGSYTLRSDVYSFGVVMLELLTGRKAYDRSRPRGEQSLVRWAISRLHDIDALSKMVDPSIKGAYPSKSLSRFADIISLCIQREPEFRPQMSEIVQDLLHLVN